MFRHWLCPFWSPAFAIIYQADGTPNKRGLGYYNRGPEDRLKALEVPGLHGVLRRQDPEVVLAPRELRDLARVYSLA